MEDCGDGECDTHCYESFTGSKWRLIESWSDLTGYDVVDVFGDDLIEEERNRMSAEQSVVKEEDDARGFHNRSKREELLRRRWVWCRLPNTLV